MSGLFGLLGLAVFICGFLNIAKITDVGLKFVSLSQIQTLPLLNAIPAGLVFLIIGLVIMAIAGAFYRSQHVTIINENA